MNTYQVILNEGANIVKVIAEEAYSNGHGILCFTVKINGQNSVVAQFKTWDGWNLLAPAEVNDK